MHSIGCDDYAFVGENDVEPLNEEFDYKDNFNASEVSDRNGSIQQCTTAR